MKLYHIHKFNDIKDDFKVGDILETNDLNRLRKDQLNCSSSYLKEVVKNDKGTFNMYEPLDSLLEMEKLEKMSREEIVKTVDLLKEYIHNNGIYRRESVLEEVRRESFIELPSRYKCMWLTDEECIESWLRLLGTKEGHYSINEMELDGNLFCSTDDLLPNYYEPIKNIYADAYRYWGRTQQNLDESDKREYLFEGQAKVLRKLK